MKLKGRLKNNEKEYALFSRFLKENGISKAFWRNLLNPKSAYDKCNNFCWMYHSDVIDFISNCNPYSYVDDGFIWIKQPEGEDFWNKYHEKWRDYLHRKNNEV